MSFFGRTLAFWVKRSGESITFDFSGATVDGATYTRVGSAWRWDASGDVSVVAEDAGIFDYIENAGALLGLRWEDANTNLLTAGRDLSGWDLTDVSHGDVLGVDGSGTNASTLTASATDGTAYEAFTTLTSGLTYTFSAWVKRRTGTGRVDITGDGGTTLKEISADLIGSGWQKVFIEFVADGTDTVGFKLSTDTDAIDVDCCRVELGPIARGPTLTDAATVNASVLWCPAGSGLGYLFDPDDFPAWDLRGGRDIDHITLSSVDLGGGTATVSVYYFSHEPSSPLYNDETASLSLTFAPGIGGALQFDGDDVQFDGAAVFFDPPTGLQFDADDVQFDGQQVYLD